MADSLMQSCAKSWKNGTKTKVELCSPPRKHLDPQDSRSTTGRQSSEMLVCSADTGGYECNQKRTIATGRFLSIAYRKWSNSTIPPTHSPSNRRHYLQVKWKIIGNKQRVPSSNYNKTHETFDTAAIRKYWTHTNKTPTTQSQSDEQKS